MPETEIATLYVEVEFDPSRTDSESLAIAFNRLRERLCETDRSTTILSEYGPTVVGEFYAADAMPTRFVTTVQILDPDSGAPVAVEIRKTQGGYLVGIDGSYLEQDVGPVYDPYRVGSQLEIPKDENNISSSQEILR